MCNWDHQHELILWLFLCTLGVLTFWTNIVVFSCIIIMHMDTNLCVVSVVRKYQIYSSTNFTKWIIFLYLIFYSWIFSYSNFSSRVFKDIFQVKILYYFLSSLSCLQPFPCTPCSPKFMVSFSLIFAIDVCEYIPKYINATCSVCVVLLVGVWFQGIK